MDIANRYMPPLKTAAARMAGTGRRLAAGLVFSLVIAASAAWIADREAISRLGISTLTVAIVLGLLIGNTFFHRVQQTHAPGVDFARSSLLRLAIILYGFRITFQELSIVGWSGALIGALILSSTFIVAVFLGARVLKLDRETAMLIGAGSAICGVAAIMATAPVVRARPEKVAVAVATIVVFGTLAMFLYPALYPYLGLSEHAYGVFVGSTVHEVAQVVVAGGAVGEQAAAAAVVGKMLRVMLLAPFLLLLSHYMSSSHSAGTGKRGQITVPWFAVLFLVVTGINSAGVVPDAVVTLLVQLDTVLLGMAMAALGLRTNVSAIRQAGSKPLALGLMLFVFLGLGGYFVNAAVGLLV